MSPVPTGPSVIELLNIIPDEVFPHQLIYIAGHITSINTTRDANFVYVSVNMSDTTKWGLVGGRFKCFLNLSVGKNTVQFHCDDDKEVVQVITCYFTPRRALNRVKFVYIKCKDTPGEFQTLNNSDNSMERALKLLHFNSLLCQLYFAECLVAAGFSRTTFSLAPLEVLETELTEFESLTDDFLEKNNKIFGYFYEELERKGKMEEDVKIMGILGCTR